MEYFALEGGDKIPTLGLGTYRIVDRDICIRSVKTSIELGYRHIDTAEVYGNQDFVGEAIKESGVKREDLFITTKIWVSEYKHVEESFKKDLKRLGLEYVDLLLLHQPIGKYVDAFKELIELKKKGLVKHIGVSNFEEKHIEKLIEETGVKPEVDQIELHPFYQRNSLCAYLKEKEILIEAWYPLANAKAKLLQNQTLKAMADKKGRTVAQIVLRWHYENGHITFPRATNPSHMKENLEIFSFSLNEEETNLIASLNKNKGYDAPMWMKQIVCRMNRPK